MATIIDPPNSVWPNGLKVDSEGYVTFYPLGTNKVDITTITWPDGDKLISPFVYDENDKLVGFVDTKAMTVSGSATTTMTYSHIEADFSSISEGSLTIDAPNATVKKFSWAVSTGGETFDFVIIDFNTTDQETIDTVRTAKRVVDNKLYDADDNLIGTIDTSKIEVSGIYDFEAMIADGLFCNMDMEANSRGIVLSEFNSDLSSLRDGSCMFAYNTNLTTFSSDLSNMTNGPWMFANCENLTSFASDLSKLTNGEGMLSRCFNLTSFSSDLSSLTNGRSMFIFCENLTSFTTDLSSLTDGGFMFQDCQSLTMFNSNLSNLTDGETMFGNCLNLTSFSSDLSSLTEARGMFDDCKLDVPSVKNIIDTINTASPNAASNILMIGIGCDDTEADKDLFAQEVGYANMSSLLKALNAKGWTVMEQFNGRPTTTYGLRRPSEDTLPVFVKLEEIEEHADYTSMDGSKKYRLDWFHETTGSTEGHTQYATLEEAIETLNIKPIERN